MKKLVFLLFPILLVHVQGFSKGSYILENKKSVYLTGIEYTLLLRTDSTEGYGLFNPVIVNHNGNEAILLKTVTDSIEGTFSMALSFPMSGAWTVHDTQAGYREIIRVIPGWLSLFPPLIAIILALLTRQVLIALFAGIWFGATVLFGYNPLYGFLQSLSGYIGKAPADEDRIAILIFSLTLGGMIGVISKAGGTQGIIERITKYASSVRSGQLATWFMGILVFFDDYANTLIVGNTMRPLTDRLRISREKLAYLVDSTAAPVATIAIISTWIGYQLSLISNAFRTIGLKDNAYITFFKTIPYSFYPLLALFFGFLVATLGRDLFSMYHAEKRAFNGDGLLRDGAVPLADLNTEELTAKPGIPLRWYNALIPILMVIVSTLGGLWFTGYAATPADAADLARMDFIQYVSIVVGNADSFAVLMWASFIGSITAITLALVQRILNLNEAIMAWVSGVKAMVMAALILTMAWAIGNICTDIQTAEYVISLTSGMLSPHLLPALSFLIAGVIAFSTGTSWGTMAILTPIVIPLAWQLPLGDPLMTEATRQSIFLSSIASILSGATFGDHCSPISDTTIMSSMASGSDHIDHVRTQLPYAVIVALTSMMFGFLPAGFGISPWLSLLFGMILIAVIIRFFGKRAYCITSEQKDL